MMSGRGRQDAAGFFKNVTLPFQIGHLLAQPAQLALGRLYGQGLWFLEARARQSVVHPTAQGAMRHTQIADHFRDGASAPDQSDGVLFEIAVIDYPARKG